MDYIGSSALHAGACLSPLLRIWNPYVCCTSLFTLSCDTGQVKSSVRYPTQRDAVTR
jgi:hypothetical protein